MTSQPSRPPDAHAQVMTADRLRLLIADSLTDQTEVTACRPISTIYADRLALSVEDRAGQLWRVHVLTQARSCAATSTTRCPLSTSTH